MGLFNRDPKKAWGKKLGEAQEARDNEDYSFALTLYDELIPEAEALSGAEHGSTVATRVARAETRLEGGDAEQARDELLSLVDQVNKAFGPTDDFAFHTRGQLAVAYGITGEHAKAKETFASALADAEAALGADNETTKWLRGNLRTSNSLAGVVELDRLLLIASDPASAAVPELEWHQRVERAKGSQPGSYRSKARWSFADGEESAEWEWVIEFARPDRFDIQQTTRTASEDLYDQWMQIGDRHYSFIGYWTDDTAAKHLCAPRAETTHSLELERCLEFLRSEEPDAARAPDRPGRLLELHYTNGNLARRRMSDTPPSPSDRGTTVIWLDNDDLVVKAESTFAGNVEGDGVQAKLEQTFGAYDEEISIEAPEVVATLDAEGAAEIDPDALPAGVLD